VKLQTSARQDQQTWTITGVNETRSTRYSVLCCVEMFGFFTSRFEKGLLTPQYNETFWSSRTCLQLPKGTTFRG